MRSQGWLVEVALVHKPATDWERLATEASTIKSREIGLGIAFHLARYFLRTEHLHYGYWPEDLTVEIHNAARAQELYTESLIDEIPEAVESVLDVGCGSGATAVRMIERGYSVDCVTQNGPLAEVARENLSGRGELFVCPFQEFESSRRYQLILFSESLLFIRPLEVALEKALSLLREDGYVLVSDLFRRPSEQPTDPSRASTYHRGSIGGGYYLEEFRQAVSKFPLKLIRETDVTERIAPSFDLLARTIEELRPAYELGVASLRYRRPRLLRLARWFFRLEKYEAKWFGGRYSAANFIRDKSYRRLLYRAASPSKEADRPI